MSKKPLPRPVPSRRAVAVVAAVAATVTSSAALAQTSASWQSPVAGLWSNPANWSGGVVPDNGGTATFGTVPLARSPGLVGLDIDITLGRLVFDNGLEYQISSGGDLAPDTTLTFTGPANIDVLRSRASTPTIFPIGHIINRPVAGSSGLNVTGNGTLSLVQPNSFSGDLNVNGATLGFNRGDATFGAAGNAINLTNAGLRSFNLSGVPATPLVTDRRVTLAGDNTLQPTNDTTFNNVISGSGGLTTFGGTGDVTLTAENTYAGDTNIRTGTALTPGQFILSGNGTIASQTVRLVGALTLDNSGVARDDRLAPTADVISSGGRVSLGGNASAAVSQSFGSLVLDSGRTEVILQGAAPTELVAAELVRNNGATAFLRGLSNTSTGPALRVTGDYSGQLIGGGGSAGSTNVSILPYVIGNTATNSFVNGNTFVTVGADGRFRSLDLDTEYQSDIALAGPTDNVRLAPTAGGAANPLVLPSGPRTVNSLIVSLQAGFGNALTVVGDAPLTVASGAVAVTPTSTLNSTTFDVPLDFGAAEGVLHNTSGITVAFLQPLSGSGGLTVGGGGLVSFRDGAVSTYSGQTKIVNGTVQINGDVRANQAGPFGISDTAVVLAPGSGGSSSRILANGVFEIDRDVIVRGDGTAPATLGTTITTSATSPPVGLTVNGDISLEGLAVLNLEVSTSATSLGAALNGTISGPGGISGSGNNAGVTTLNGSNTFAGGTNILLNTFVAGSDTAFGTGTIFASAPGSSLSGIGATNGPRTLQNRVVLGGNLQLVAGDDLTLAGDVDLGGNNARFLRVAADTTLTLAGEVSAGGIVTDRTGTLVLAGDNTFTAGLQIGGFTSGNNPQAVDGGTVVLASQQAAGLSNVNVFVGRLQTDEGGDVIDLAGDLTVGELGTLALDFGSAGDLLDLAGDLSLDGTLEVVVGSGFDAGTYDFALFDGTFVDNGVVVTGLPDGFTASVVASGGVASLSVVPEPGSLALLATAGLLGLRRRRR